MHRLLVDSAELERNAPTLSREAAHHLRVLRLKDGEEVELFDGDGRTRLCRFSPTGLVPKAELVEHPRPTRRLELFAALTKAARWDWTVEKATELGVSRIVPVVSERVVVRLDAAARAEKRARWRRLAEEAARQSDAVFIPEIAAPLDFDAALAESREKKSFVGALVSPPPPPFFQALAALDRKAVEAASSFAVWIGPEGDWTARELDALLAVATPVSLGSRILRAETAAICALSVLRSFLDVPAR